MHSFYVDLKNFDLVQVSGSDAVRFLQGQLTCDMQALSEGAVTFGAACNNKGRIYAAFMLMRQNGDYFFLMAPGVGGTFINNLKKFIPFYQCDMQLVNTAWSCLGICGSEITTYLENNTNPMPAAYNSIPYEDGWLCNISATNDIFLLCTKTRTHATLVSKLFARGTAAHHDNWLIQNMLAGHFPFSIEDVDKYTPQELNYDRNGYVNFSKGCYTGQEIVARMHYRGKAKKQLYVLQITDHDQTQLPEKIEVLDENQVVLGTTIKLLLADNKNLYLLINLPVELGATKLFTALGQRITNQPLQRTV